MLMVRVLVIVMVLLFWQQYLTFAELERKRIGLDPEGQTVQRWARSTVSFARAALDMIVGSTAAVIVL
jgi:hypothetical protein